MPAASWAWVAVLGVVNTGLGCFLYFSSFEGLSAQTVAILGYLEPLSAVVCALMFLGEPMGLWEAVGGVLIIGGAILGTAPGKKPEMPV
ncbi:EamA family transporter [Adlercreutzia sp. ZJ473]|uniref:EamA family transporter n=1 Tax=Adlercreutzia sp. ZJ473 TaxID=2722822 RepID=UPI0035302F0D